MCIYPLYKLSLILLLLLLTEVIRCAPYHNTASTPISIVRFGTTYNNEDVTWPGVFVTQFNRNDYEASIYPQTKSVPSVITSITPKSTSSIGRQSNPITIDKHILSQIFFEDNPDRGIGLNVVSRVGEFQTTISENSTDPTDDRHNGLAAIHAFQSSLGR